MRYLGIDYGTKKIGIALSDEGGEFAFPHSILPNTPSFFDVIQELCKEYSITKIVVGYSLSQYGNENELTKKIYEVTKVLEEQCGISVVLQNELFSSVEAHRYQIKKGDRDDSAAAIILQRFLDAKK